MADMWKAVYTTKHSTAVSYLINNFGRLFRILRKERHNDDCYRNTKTLLRERATTEKKQKLQIIKKIEKKTTFCATKTTIRAVVHHFLCGMMTTLQPTLIDA